MVNFNDLDKYIVINKNDYSLAIKSEEGRSYIGNVSEITGHGMS